MSESAIVSSMDSLHAHSRLLPPMRHGISSDANGLKEAIDQYIKDLHRSNLESNAVWFNLTESCLCMLSSAHNLLSLVDRIGHHTGSQRILRDVLIGMNSSLQRVFKAINIIEGSDASEYEKSNHLSKMSMAIIQSIASQRQMIACISNLLHASSQTIDIRVIRNALSTLHAANAELCDALLHVTNMLEAYDVTSEIPENLMADSALAIFDSAEKACAGWNEWSKHFPDKPSTGRSSELTSLVAQINDRVARLSTMMQELRVLKNAVPEQQKKSFYQLAVKFVSLVLKVGSFVKENASEMKFTKSFIACRQSCLLQTKALGQEISLAKKQHKTPNKM